MYEIQSEEAEANKVNSLCECKQRRNLKLKWPAREKQMHGILIFGSNLKGPILGFHNYKRNPKAILRVITCESKSSKRPSLLALGLIRWGPF